MFSSLRSADIGQAINRMHIAYWLLASIVSVPCVTSFRFKLLTQTFLRKERISATTNADCLLQDSKSVLFVPKGHAEKSEIVKSIHDWCKEQPRTDSVVLTILNENGAKFALQAANQPFLSISVEEDDSNIQMKVAQSLPKPDHRHHSIVALLSGNLVDSISSEIGLKTLRLAQEVKAKAKCPTEEQIAPVPPLPSAHALDLTSQEEIHSMWEKSTPAPKEAIKPLIPLLKDGQEPPAEVSAAHAREAPLVLEIPLDPAEAVEEALGQLRRAQQEAAVTAAAEIGTQSDDPRTDSGSKSNRVADINSSSGSTRGQEQNHRASPQPQQQQHKQQRQQQQRDPATAQKARQIGLRLDAFKGSGIEDQAMKELNALLSSSRSEGFLSVMRDHAVNSSTLAAIERTATATGAGAGDNVGASASLGELFAYGQRRSGELTVSDILSRPTLGETAEQLRQPTPQLPLHLSGNRERVDIFQSPAELQRGQLEAPVVRPSGAVETESASYDANPTAPPDPQAFPLDQQRLYVLLTELGRTAPEMHDSVIDSYRDLMLSENMLFLLKRANTSTFESSQRQFYQKITEKTIALTAELGALVKAESVRHLETIQQVCEVAAQFQHDEEAFLARMQYLKPRFDTALLAFLSYALGEESARIRQRGHDPAVLPSAWLQVLTIVKQGVSAEFESRYRQLLEPLLLVVRFDEPALRSEIFRRFVAITPPMELPYLKALALNMIEGVLQQSERQDMTPAIVISSLPPGQDEATALSESRQGRVENIATSLSVTSCSDTTDKSLDIESAQTAKQEQQPPLTRQSSSQPVRAFTSSQPLCAAPLDPALAPRMRALQADLEAHLSDAYIRDRVRAFQEEVRRQGGEVVVRHRNPVVQAERDTARELEREQQQTAETQK